MNMLPGNMLYENIFQDRDESDVIRILSDGIQAIYNNAARLIKDSRLLLENNSYMSASFLGTTAREEMAKSHILIDACRLDFRHESTLRKLCKAFYNHIDKYAYYTVLTYSAIHNMENVREIWNVNTKAYWYSEFDSGEPDMPHDVNFLREMPLYVDYIQWDRGWFDPSEERSLLIESARRYPIEDAGEEFIRFQKTFEAGFYSERSLKIIHDNYKNVYVNLQIDFEDLERLFYDTLNAIHKTIYPDNTSHVIERNEIFMQFLPLYFFANNRNVQS